MAPILTTCRLVTAERRTGVDLAYVGRQGPALFMLVEICSSRSRWAGGTSMGLTNVELWLQFSKLSTDVGEVVH